MEFTYKGQRYFIQVSNRSCEACVCITNAEGLDYDFVVDHIDQTIEHDPLGEVGNYGHYISLADDARAHYLADLTVSMYEEEI